MERNFIHPKPQAFIFPNIGKLSSSIFRTSMAIHRLAGLINEHQNRIEAIMTSIDDGILILGKDGIPIIQNAIGEKYFTELCSCNIKGEKCNLHNTINEIQKQTLTSINRELKSNGKVYNIKLKLINKNKDSERIAIRICCYPDVMNNQNSGHPADIFPQISEFTAAIAHEINNPLTPILGLSSCQKTNDLKSSELSKQLEIIHHSGERIAHVVHQLLNFDEIHRWSKFKTIQLNKVVKNTISQIRSEFKKSNIQIKTFLSSGLPAIHINEEQLKQIILHLLNSIRINMVTTGIGTSITISTNTNNKSLNLKISHNGSKYPENFSLKNSILKTDRIKNFKNLHFLFAELLAQKNNIKIHFSSNTISCSVSRTRSN